MSEVSRQLFLDKIASKISSSEPSDLHKAVRADTGTLPDLNDDDLETVLRDNPRWHQTQRYFGHPDYMTSRPHQQSVYSNANAFLRSPKAFKIPGAGIGGPVDSRRPTDSHRLHGLAGYGYSSQPY